MPNENVSYVASGTIGVARFVKQGGAAFRCSEAGANAVLLGVSQEGSHDAPGIQGNAPWPAASDGQYLKVYGQGDHCVLVAGANVSAGNWLKADANGFGKPIDTTVTADPENYGFRALEHMTSGNLVRGVVDIGSYIDN